MKPRLRMFGRAAREVFRTVGLLVFVAGAGYFLIAGYLTVHEGLAGQQMADDPEPGLTAALEPDRER